MKKILTWLFIGFIFARSANSFGFDITDYQWWAIVITISYSYYILTYDNTTSSKRNLEK